MNKRDKKLAWGLLAALLVFMALAFVTPKSYAWIPSIFCSSYFLPTLRPRRKFGDIFPERHVQVLRKEEKREP